MKIELIHTEVQTVELSKLRTQGFGQPQIAQHVGTFHYHQADPDGDSTCGMSRQCNAAAATTHSMLARLAALHRNRFCQVPVAAFTSLTMDEAYPHAHGNCQGWMGRVMQLKKRQQLGAWDQHGPTGRLFYRWATRNGVCGRSGCWKAPRGAA